MKTDHGPPLVCILQISDKDFAKSKYKLNEMGMLKKPYSLLAHLTFLNIYYVSNIVPSYLQVLTYFILTVTLFNRHYNQPHFPDGETEVQEAK